MTTRGRNPRMLSEPTIAIYKQVEGYATFASLFPQYTVEPGYNVYRVVLSLRRIPKRPQLQFSDKNQNENRGTGSKVPKQDPVMFELYCDHYYCWLVMMTVSLADVLRAGNVRTKLRPMHRGPIHG